MSYIDATTNESWVAREATPADASRELSAEVRAGVHFDAVEAVMQLAPPGHVGLRGRFGALPPRPWSGPRDAAGKMDVA